jgi:iron(III) transport system ATP-binding protein
LRLKNLSAKSTDLNAAAKGSPAFAGGRGRAAATIAAKLTFDAVERWYGETRALRGFSLEIAPAEVVCLLGPSGCGKTTLLRVAAGIEKPSSGRILINEREMAGPTRFVPPEQRGIGLMFQDFALFPHLSILDNVAFGLKALPRADALREARAMLARVGLENLEGEFPHTLSGGQQQRVALARALVPRPSVVLMDEPFSGLDVQLRDTMQEETRALLRETRATSMIVTHHPEEAMRLADRIAVMHRGSLAQAGTAEDLYSRPADLFVARLFSEINEFAYRTSGGEIDTPFGRFPANGLAEGAIAVLCVRERGVRITRSGPGLSGRILQAKFLGDVRLLEIGVTGFDQPLRVRLPSGEMIEKGEDVSLEVDRQQIMVFGQAARNGD